MAVFNSSLFWIISNLSYVCCQRFVTNSSSNKKRAFNNHISWYDAVLASVMWKLHVALILMLTADIYLTLNDPYDIKWSFFVPDSPNCWVQKESIN